MIHAGRPLVATVLLTWLRARPARNEVEKSRENVVLVGNTRPVRVESTTKTRTPSVDSQTQQTHCCQEGPGSCFFSSPTCRHWVRSHHFRLLLLRRLQLPFPMKVRSCTEWPPSRCSWPSPRCLRTGWGLGRRGVALESVVARICREAGGRVSTNVLLRDLDLHAPIAADGRRLEVAVVGCHCSQWPWTRHW